jgi:formiminotetrahydrofolate cyclodeaminase
VRLLDVEEHPFLLSVAVLEAELSLPVVRIAPSRRTSRSVNGDVSVADQTLDDFLAALAAPAPSPCGGATAAITAAMAASLVIMVARGSRDWQEGAAAEASAAELRDRLLCLARADTEAVAGLLALGRLAEPERAEALERAIRVPASIAAAARETAALAELAEAHGKRVMSADAHAARLLADAAARTAEAIVVANGGSGAG